MKTSLLVRAVALVGSLTVTLALVQSVALSALPPQIPGQLLAQASVGMTCVH